MKRKESILLIAAIVLAAASMRAPISSVGPLTSLIRTDLGLSAAAAGMLTTIPLIFFAVFSYIAGRYLSRFSANSLILTCLVCIIVGSLLRSYCGLTGLYCGIAFIGIGIGILNVLLPPLIRQNFAARIGLVMGIYNSSLNLFSGLGSGLSAILAGVFGSWRPAAAIWGSTAIIALPLWLLNRKNGTQPEKTDNKHIKYSLDLKAWIIAAFMGMQALIYFSIVAWLPTILKTKTDLAQAPGMLMLWLQILSIVTGFLTPLLTQHKNLRRYISITGGGCYFVGLSLVLAGKSLAWLIVGCGLCGLASGICFSYALTLISLYGSTKEVTTWISGFAQMAGYILASIGPMLLGMVFDLTSKWNGPVLILISLSLIMAVTGVFAGKEKQQ